MRSGVVKQLKQLEQQLIIKKLFELYELSLINFAPLRLSVVPLNADAD